MAGLLSVQNLSEDAGLPLPWPIHVTDRDCEYAVCPQAILQSGNGDVSHLYTMSQVCASYLPSVQVATPEGL
jgi:hypothetical protein